VLGEVSVIGESKQDKSGGAAGMIQIHECHRGQGTLGRSRLQAEDDTGRGYGKDVDSAGGISDRKEQAVGGPCCSPPVGKAARGSIPFTM
jgi:hypothetical protein